MTETMARPTPGSVSAGAEPADVFVVFGITGDLAKVMTFRSLYRLEQRGLLDCPIVGVAVDDWTLEQLVERARTSIVGTGEQLDEKVFDRFAARLSYVAGRLRATPRPTSASARPSAAPSTPVFYLEIPPFLFGTVVKGLAEAGLTKNARVVVEKPFGHDLASATALADELHQYIDESQLFRIDHYLGKMGLEEILYLRFANTMLEPVWNRNYIESRPDHDGRGLRRRGSRPLLRPGRRAARRGRQPPHAGGRGDRDGAARRRRSGDAQGRAGLRCSAPSAPADPAHYVRGQYDGYRAIDGVAAGLDHRDVRRAAARDRELALVGRAVLHPRRQAAAGRPRPSSGSSSSSRRVSASRRSTDRPDARTSSSIKLDPATGDPDRSSRPTAADARERRADQLDMEFAEKGGEGPRRTRCCCTRRWSARRRASRGRTASSRRGGSCSRCSTRRRPVHAYAPGSWGPARPTRSSQGMAAGTSPWIAP